MKETLPLNQDWLFHLGDIPIEEAHLKSPLYTEAKAERKRCGPAAKEYLDAPDYYNPAGLISHETWTDVQLPHDYVILQTPKEEENGALGYFHYENAWYRKHFILSAEDSHKRITLLFEAVAIHCKIYVNGCYMLANNCGYNSFEVDITDVAVFGGENVVAVFIDVSEHEGWWYEGAGIYRPVWLIKAEPVSVDLYGVFVHPEKCAECWRVPIETTLRNDGYESRHVRVNNVIVDANDFQVASLEDEVVLPPRSVQTFHQETRICNPRCWDIENPNLYTLQTALYTEEGMCENQTNRFGFRSIRFDAQRGFFLNEKPVKIKGVCCHQDYGLTGKAVPPRIQRYRLELLKEMGANGYRCAHYPHSAYTMDRLDELGFLVMAETRWFQSTPEGMQQLEMLIRRDRNHPSIILWSVGNEEPLHLTSAGQRTARAMIYRVKELDGTRPVTTAVSHDPCHSSVVQTVDVMGVNYNLSHLDLLHQKHPDLPLLSSECAATGSTRGWYGPDCPERGYLNGYDHDVNKTFLSREHTWKFILAREWLAGGFQWAGIEHRGETVWPRLCSQSGAIDLFLNRKDAFYQNQSHWLERPMVHLLPHWNWEGMEDIPIRVYAYTNCEHVSLYLNGRCLGERTVETCGHAEWEVPYEGGRLEAYACRNGEQVAYDCVETTGPAVSLRLTLEREGVKADGEDIAIITCDCVDQQGRHVPTAEPFVRFYTNENGVLLGTGSDVCDHVPVTNHDRQMRAGLISLIVRAGCKRGTLLVWAQAQGLHTGVLAVPLY